MPAGDRVVVETKEESFEGVLMPEEENVIVLKLDTGYNIGFDKKNVKSVKVLSKKKESPKFSELILKETKGLPTISILHTGGTIASKVDYETGAVYNKFTPEELLKMFPELSHIANIQSRLVRNMSSEDMRFAHYNILAKEVEKEVKNGVKGVIITHGTDTLHYSSAALAFALQNIPISVILVGAQRSSDRGSSDAAANLLCAANFISKIDFSGVAVCMHDGSGDNSCAVFSATKVRKMHTSARDAFKAINTTPIALVNYETKEVKFLQKTKKPEGKFTVQLFDEKLKVGLIKTHTNMFASEFEAFDGFDGLVIEGTGLGHAPINEIDDFTKEHTKILKAIEKLTKKTIIAMASQTIYGAIDMNVYSPGRKLVSLGVLGNYSDMTPETTFIKLAWLLSNYKKDEVKKLFSQNLVGEISEGISKE